MLCVSISNLDFNGCLEALQGQEMAEIRLDLLSLSLEEVEKIFSLPVKLIATCRPGKQTPENRIKLLVKAISSGAAYIDIEYEASLEEKQFFVKSAEKAGCKVIISYHNYNSTPSMSDLELIVEDCFIIGADIAKIACMVNHEKDSARLLSLYDLEKYKSGIAPLETKKRQIVAIGMGEKGVITRVASIFLGAPFTFVSNNQIKTAPGQLDKQTMQKIIELLKSNHE
jgi:3-dehydroquinate dehydratase type I